LNAELGAEVTVGIGINLGNNNTRLLLEGLSELLPNGGKILAVAAPGENVSSTSPARGVVAARAQLAIF